MKIIEIIQEETAIEKAQRVTNTLTKSPVYSIFKALGLTYLVVDFNNERDKLLADLDKFKKLNGKVDASNKFYGDITIEKAQAHYNELLIELVRHMTTRTVALLFGEIGLKAVFYAIAGLIKTFVPLVGGPAGAVIKLLSMLVQIGLPAALVWLEANKGTFAKIFDEFYLTLAGLVDIPFMNTVIDQIDNAADSLGITKKGQVNNAFSLPADPNNFFNKITKPIDGPIIGGKPATNDGTHLTLEPGFYSHPLVIDDIRISIRKGEGNPLDKIPKLQGKKYPTWNPNQENFTFPNGFATQWAEFVANRDKK